MSDTDSRGKIVIYNAPDGSIQTDVRLASDTLWLTQYQMEELFGTDRTSVVKHIRNILATDELEKSATCAKFSQVRQEGSRKVSRKILHYNLDMIISVGYRVNSKRGTQFRIWANRILKEHLVKGYTINQKRLMEQQSRLQELKESIGLVERSLLSEVQNIEEARSISQMYQSFGGKELYPSIEHKAAMLLYLVIKNHSFVDGNKRIAAALFLYFLERNRLLYRADGDRIIGNDGLATLTLLIAVSKPEEMATMINIILTILNRGQP